MKKLASLVLSFGFFITMSAQEMKEGIWLTGMDNTKIETYQKEGAWFGKVVSSDNPKAKIGNDILRDFKQVDDEWVGKIFIARRGRTADATIEPADNELKIAISAGFMSRTLVWKKAEDQ